MANKYRVLFNDGSEEICEVSPTVIYKHDRRKILVITILSVDKSKCNNQTFRKGCAGANMTKAKDFMNFFMKKIKSTSFEDLKKTDEKFIRDIVDKISTI